jgi:hypothetical protein
MRQEAIFLQIGASIGQCGYVYVGAGPIKKQLQEESGPGVGWWRSINQARTRKGGEEEDDGWGAVVCAGAGAGVGAGRRGEAIQPLRTWQIVGSLSPTLPAAAALLSKERGRRGAPSAGSPHPHPMCVCACREACAVRDSVGPGRRAGAGGGRRL